MYHARVETLPEDLKLTAVARAQFEAVSEVERELIIRRSEHLWVLMDRNQTTLLVAGILVPTLTSTPELWVLICEDFRRNLRRNLRQARSKIQADLLALYPHVHVKVDAATPHGVQFVRMLGFHEYHREEFGDREYIYFEVGH